MRLSEWRAAAPNRDALGSKVLGVIEPVLAALGAGSDPHCWPAWGDDVATRYALLALTPAGLAVVHVRLNVPGEGPRATGKLVRWGRLQVGELSVETQGGHRLLSVQVEGVVMRGVDDEADAISRFALAVLAGIDGRPLPDLDAAGGRRRAAGRVTAPASGTAGRAKPPAPNTTSSRRAGGNAPTPASG